MKKILEAIGITILKFFANFIYLFLKCMPTKNRIVMISRQSNNITLDFSLLRDKINELDSSTSNNAEGINVLTNVVQVDGKLVEVDNEDANKAICSPTFAFLLYF